MTLGPGSVRFARRCVELLTQVPKPRYKQNSRSQGLKISLTIYNTVSKKAVTSRCHSRGFWPQNRLFTVYQFTNGFIPVLYVITNTSKYKYINSTSISKKNGKQ
jgi:hypothetical protein